MGTKWGQKKQLRFELHGNEHQIKNTANVSFNPNVYNGFTRSESTC